MLRHEFGGDWTTEKLTCLRKYLNAYRTIFTNNPKARFYITHYVDAFAGTGYRSVREEKKSAQIPLFLQDDEGTEEAISYLKGSAQISLEVESPFDHYWFVEKKRAIRSGVEDTKTKLPGDNQPNTHSSGRRKRLFNGLV